MARPTWRNNDDNPKRGDDMRISAMGVEVEASGRTVIFVIVAVVLGMLSVAGFYMASVSLTKHDDRTALDHSRLVTSVERVVDTMEVMTCVLTLNDQERVRFRETGQYCSSYNTQQSRRAQQQRQFQEESGGRQ